MLGADPTMTIVLCAVPQFEVHFILLPSGIVFCLCLVNFFSNGYSYKIFQVADVVNSYCFSFGFTTNITFSLTNHYISIS